MPFFPDAGPAAFAVSVEATVFGFWKTQSEALVRLLGLQGLVTWRFLPFTFTAMFKMTCLRFSSVKPSMMPSVPTSMFLRYSSHFG